MNGFKTGELPGRGHYARWSFSEDGDGASESSIGAADRTGFGPATKSTHLHLHANLAEKLEAARKRVEVMRKAEVEEIDCEQI